MEESAEKAAMLAGASAAKILAEACESSPSREEPSLKLEVVRDLARNLERHLAGLAAESPTPGLLAEAAQKCSDLATLAACNAEELEDPRSAAESVRLAAEATEALFQKMDAENPPDDDENAGSGLVRRDARSASWKASLAARQMDGSLRSGES